MSCTNHPPPKGWKCLDCWACGHPPNSTKGICTKSELVGPDKSITTCEAGGSKAKPLFKTKSECLKNCGEAPGVTCYMCQIRPDQEKGSCVSIHPSQGGKPLKECPNWANVFPTLKECRDKCNQSGPIKPVAKCWSSFGSKCECTLGNAEGPNGPLDSCEPDQGFYNTKSACQKACSGGDNKMIWIIVAVSVAVLTLLVVIGLIIYFVESR